MLNRLSTKYGLVHFMSTIIRRNVNVLMDTDSQINTKKKHTSRSKEIIMPPFSKPRQRKYNNQYSSAYQNVSRKRDNHSYTAYYILHTIII